MVSTYLIGKPYTGESSEAATVVVLGGSRHAEMSRGQSCDMKPEAESRDNYETATRRLGSIEVCC